MIVEEENFLLSFGLVSLFTKIMVDATKVIKKFMEKDTTKLVKVCLKST